MATTATSLTCGMAVEDVLDLLGADVLAAAEDDVLLPAADGDRAVAVDAGQIAGVEVAVRR